MAFQELVVICSARLGQAVRDRETQIEQLTQAEQGARHHRWPSPGRSDQYSRGSERCLSARRRTMAAVDGLITDCHSSYSRPVVVSRAKNPGARLTPHTGRAPPFGCPQTERRSGAVTLESIRRNLRPPDYEVTDRHSTSMTTAGEVGYDSM